MPVTGLPRILEHTLNNILEDLNLASYKIAGSELRTTIVLRFDARMADASESPIHQSTPQSGYRRKPPSQIKRDRKRQEQHLKPSTEKSMHQNNSLTENSIITAVHSIPADRDDSALHSQSVLDRPRPESTARFTRQETTYSVQERDKPNNSPAYIRTNEKKETKSQHDKEKLQLFVSTLVKETTEKEERRLKVHSPNSSQDLSHSQDGHDTASEHSSDDTGSPNTSKPGIPKRQDADNSDHNNIDEPTASKSSSAENSEQKDSYKSRPSTSETSATDETAQTHQHCTSDKGSKQNVTQQANKLPCDKVQLKIFHYFHMKKDTRQRVIQPERNNSFSKIVLDTYDCQCVMVAETDDLIIEYCMREETITNLCLKEGEEESQYSRMRKRHLREWPDDTLRIEEEGNPEAISEFQKQLTQLKSFISTSRY